MLDLPSENKQNLLSVKYRAIMKTKQPRKIISDLANAGITATIPIEDWELLDDRSLFPNALNLIQKSVSLPIYPKLSDEDTDIIISLLK